MRHEDLWCFGSNPLQWHLQFLSFLSVVKLADHFTTGDGAKLIAKRLYNPPTKSIYLSSVHSSKALPTRSSTMGSFLTDFKNYVSRSPSSGTMPDEQDTDTETSISIPETNKNHSISTYAPRHRNVAARPGKFTDLKDFMSVPQRYLTDELEYVPAVQARLEPSCIIHILDRNSRLHNRVMLMIKDYGSFSMGCVSFCRHRPALSSHNERQIHRLVRQSGAQKEGAVIPRMCTVEVELPWGDAQLSDGITINLQEIWNVEKEVNVAILGRMTDWEEVWHQISEVFMADSPSRPVVAESHAGITRTDATTREGSTHRQAFDMGEDVSYTSTTVHNPRHRRRSRRDGSGSHSARAGDRQPEQPHSTHCRPERTSNARTYVKRRARMTPHNQQCLLM